MSDSSATPRPTRADFRHFEPIQTRWADNDIYGHVNNVAYYAWFDTAVNAWLIRHAALDIHGGQTIGLVVHTECDYHASLSYPAQLEIGLRVERLGTSSVRYLLGVFEIGASDAAAVGRFVHVYVDRASRRSQPLPDAMRAALQTLC